MSITAQNIIDAAFTDIGVLSPGETLEAAFAADGLLKLNGLVSWWATQSLTSLVNQRSVFTLIANQATYLIGPGGTNTSFQVARPMVLDNAGILLNATTPAVEKPIGQMTDDMYANLSIKTLVSTLFTQVYYNPTMPNGTVFLWPTPNTADNNLVLYYRTVLAEFADYATTLYTLAPAFQLALEYNLALLLATPYGREVPALILKLASDTLSDLKRQNVRMADLAFDPALIGPSAKYRYNIQTDQP